MGVAQLFNLIVALMPTAGVTAVIIAAIKYGPDWMEVTLRWRETERAFEAEKAKRTSRSKASKRRRRK